MNLDDHKYIKRCFELAAKGLGRVSPNPLVGSVIVHNDVIIGEGYHQQYGENHAEVNALNSVKNKSLLPFSTVYVNLEPCAHYGKTPPCALRLIDEKIAKVVISNVDTFEKVAGKGVEMLKNAGVQVVTSVLEEEGRWLNRRFFSYHERKRPYIVLKWAQTKDGFIDIHRTGNANNTSNWITNHELKVLVHKWRSEEDAIMVGSHTVTNDNPQLNVREWSGKSPIRVIIDTEHLLSRDSHVFDGSVNTILFVDKIYENLSSAIEQILMPSQNRLSFIMKVLYDKQIQSILIEGGQFLLQSLLVANLWDEARVLIGNKYFKDGLHAPQISGVPLSSKNIGGDFINTYINQK